MIKKGMARSVIVAVVVVGMLTLCLVATKPLTNTAFAKTPSSLVIQKEAHAGGWAGLKWDLKVGLYTSGSPVSGATINIIGEGGALKNSISKSVKTDFRGVADWLAVDLAQSEAPYTFKANYAGDSQHDAATATTTFYIH
jgi:hypothetical protein